LELPHKRGGTSVMEDSTWPGFTSFAYPGLGPLLVDVGQHVHEPFVLGHLPGDGSLHRRGGLQLEPSC